MIVSGGETNVSTYFAMRLAADGTAATGLTATDFDLQYVRSGAAPSTKVDATAGTAGGAAAHSDNTVVEPDATDQPGLYRVDWPDAAFTAGVREVILTVKVATAFTEHLRVEIDPQVNVVEWNGTDVASPDTAGYPIVTIKDGTGAGEIALTSGAIDTVTTNTDMRGTDSAALATVATEARLSELDAGTGGKMANQVDIIQTDTTTDIPAQITGLNNVAATDIVSAGAIATLSGAVVNVDLVDTVTTYTGNTPQTADHAAAIADIPTVAEFNARTLAAAAYFDPAADTVANVTLVATTTTNTDMVSAAPTAAQNRAEMDSNSTQLAAIVLDTGTTLQGELDAIQSAVITNASGVDIAADIIALKAETALIVADTNELQSDNVPGLIATLDAVVDTVKVDTAAILIDTAEIGAAGAGLTEAGGDGDHLTAIPGLSDPWSTALPGAYGAGTAGKIVGDNINAPLDTIDTVVDGIQADLSNGTDGLGAIKAETALIVADTNELQSDDVPGLISTLDAVVDTVKAETALILTDTGTTIPGTITTLQSDTDDLQTRIPTALVGGRIDASIDGTGMEAGAITAILTTQMTEAYAVDGTAPTLAQSLFLIQQALTEFAIASTSNTIKKLDGSTTAAVLTLDDATSPTSSTRTA